MPMKVKIYATLRPLVDAPYLELNSEPGSTIAEVLEEIVQRWPQLKPELLEGDGQLSGRIHFFVDGRDIRYLDGLDTVIPEGADLRIFPPVGGGA